MVSTTSSALLGNLGLAVIENRGEGKRIKAKTEEEVFDKLGLVWREPHERDCFDAIRVKENNKVFTIYDEGANKEEWNSESRHQWIE